MVKMTIIPSHPSFQVPKFANKQSSIYLWQKIEITPQLSNFLGSAAEISPQLRRLLLS